MTALDRIQKILNNIRGNAAVTLAIAIFPLMVAVGSATDLHRQANYQRKVQYALDFAALATAKFDAETNESDAVLARIAQDYFDADIAHLPEARLNPVVFTRNGSEIHLAVDGDMPTAVMHIIGRETMPIGTQASVEVKKPKLEIALVLDTSESMQIGNRMSGLRTATRNIVASMVDSGNDDIKVSIIPFADYIGVGIENAGEPWLDAEPGWNGCVYPRPGGYYQSTDAFYDIRPIPGFASAPEACRTPILPLTNDPDALNAKIDQLQPTGQHTHIPAGLIWGLRTLTDIAPYSEAEPDADFQAEGGRKILVLMSDGGNNVGPYPDGFLHAALVDQANRVTRRVCGEIKSAPRNIEIYVVALDVTVSWATAILEECATSDSHFYEASDGDDLVDVFQEILDQIDSIAITS